MASSGVQIYVPKLAASLVNNFSKGIDYGLLGKVVSLFIASAIVSAIGGTILGIFGENVIQNLRKHLWEKLTTLKVSYFDTVKAGESSRNHVDMIYSPTFVVQAREDHMINTDSANIIYNEVESDMKEIKWFEESGHVITLDKERDQLHEDVYQFLEKLDWEE